MEFRPFFKYGIRARAILSSRGVELADITELKASLLIDSVIKESITSAKFLETLLLAIAGNFNKAVESYESFLDVSSLTSKKSKPMDAASMRKTFDSTIDSLKNSK